ncbi:MAG TPA: class I SAM-dependent methyltransferase [Stellaceae bacterium]|nr:class I SAM-dependent methyltransferase [Stellaceae bacterium]
MDCRIEDLMYTLDPATKELLKESAPLMAKWSVTECKPKPVGGMEEWAKEHAQAEDSLDCDWYHGTWQYLRLLNMVAVPPWYSFYNEALSTILRRKPDAHVLISACADYGMLATLHEAIKTAKTNPRVTIYDICQTPLLSCKWYAERFGVAIECVRDNIITSPRMPLHAFDLIVTDEFLTVLKDAYKPQIVQRWKELLKPGGSIVTTAMLGGPTDQGLRDGYAATAHSLFKANRATFDAMDVLPEDLSKRFSQFAQIHTRHMLGHENQIRTLFADFDLWLSRTVTPGECVNPTSSFQIVATLP